MAKRRAFPIGEQDFQTIVERGVVYVDKTAEETIDSQLRTIGERKKMGVN